MRYPFQQLFAGLAVLVTAACSSVRTLSTVETIEIPFYVDEIAVGGDAVWLRQVDPGRPVPTGPGAVLRLDPKLKQIVARIPIPVSNFGGRIAVANGTVWVTEGVGGENLIRIDATTNQIVAIIPIDENPTRVAVGEDGVWVSGGRAIYRIDPRTNQVVHWRSLLGAGAYIAADPDAVWLTQVTQGGDKVVRIDPRTNAIVATIPVAPNPKTVLAGKGVVWVLHTPFGTHPQPSYISRIDPATNTVMGEPIQVGNWTHMALGAVYLWIGSYEGKLSRIDPQTLRQVGEPIQIKPFISQLAFGFDSVFAVSVFADPTVNPTVIHRIHEIGQKRYGANP